MVGVYLPDGECSPGASPGNRLEVLNSNIRVFLVLCTRFDDDLKIMRSNMKHPISGDFDVTTR